MAVWRGTSLARASLRTKSSRVPWLLLFCWTQATLWLCRWLKFWVQKPLMRLGIGSATDEDDPEKEEENIPPVQQDSQQQDVALPCGLVNNGNLCFVNAVLQCLAAVPAFLNTVERALRMRTQLHVVRQADDTQVQKLLVAEALVSLLRGISPDFERQELETEVETGHTPAQPERSDEEERQQFLQSEKWFLKKLKSYDPNDPRSYMHAVAKLGEVRWSYFLRQNASVVTDLFSGQTVRGSQCCSCASLTCLHEEQRIISLAIASGKGDQTLAECLEHFRHPEQLTGDNRVYCDGYCQAKTSRLTQILLQRIPPVLVLRLQRFKHTSLGGQTEKVDTPVNFPCGSNELLDITMNAFFRDDEEGEKFELVAVCAHLGVSIDSGHYVAYVRHHDSLRDTGTSSLWLRIDDDVVAIVDEATLRSETLTTAYLLFYSQVQR
ncbi:Ubiquitin-specific protease [Phytophthora megakarya]|uniref:Ubiquitin carboxyl-terminal hydrolase n=1 Tax=Phytophthora megakarya TaxID=4795 RepID=A0A225X095_9STRA|nr:Ubiquitin-specific protease [Phytophthora megakarya]